MGLRSSALTADVGFDFRYQTQQQWIQSSVVSGACFLCHSRCCHHDRAFHSDPNRTSAEALTKIERVENSKMGSSSWEQIARRKCDIRSGLINPYLGFENDREDNNIVAISDIKLLTTLYAQDKLKVQQVIKCYARK